MADIIDHKALANSRLATQFREAINLKNYMESLLLEADPLEGVFQDLISDRFIDTALGVQLDILGDIVGQPREFVEASLVGYFGFLGEPVATSFGSSQDPSVGGRFIAIGEPTSGPRLLDDDEYRTFIRARISKNITTSSPQDIIDQIKFVFGAGQVFLDERTTAYTVSIGKILSPLEVTILTDTDIIPKTAGVSVSYLINYDFDNFFSFTGIPNSKGLGSLNDPNAGGKFSSLINI